MALDTRRSAVTTPKKAASNPLDEALVSLVEELIAKEPYEVDAFKWAAQPQSFYCEKPNTSPATLRRRIAKPPFVRAWKMVGAEIVTVGEETMVIGGKKLCLLRIGEARGKLVTRREAQCLWGMTKDIMVLLPS